MIIIPLVIRHIAPSTPMSSVIVICDTLLLQLTRLERSQNDFSSFCKRVVCIYAGVRMMAGDIWREEERKCTCTHDGWVHCEPKLPGRTAHP